MTTPMPSPAQQRADGRRIWRASAAPPWSPHLDLPQEHRDEAAHVWAVAGLRNPRCQARRRRMARDRWAHYRYTTILDLVRRMGFKPW